MFVLIDLQQVALTQVGPVSPQGVQVAVSGLTRGAPVTITGSAGGVTWNVRAPEATSGSDLRVVDYAAPINVPITYTVSTISETFVSAPVTVPGSKYILQSIDGRTVIPFTWQDNGDPRDIHLRTKLHEIPGRTSQVVRWDVASGESGTLQIRTHRSATDTLREHLFTRGPIFLLRTDGTIRDIPPVQYIAVTAAPRQLWGAGGVSTDRVWTLSFELIPDPEPTVVIPTTTWADFNAAYSALTWAQFNAEWSSGTWDQFNQTIWQER